MFWACQFYIQPQHFAVAIPKIKRHVKLCVSNFWDYPFLKQKKQQRAPEPVSDFLTTPASRAAFEKELRELYENATWNEINKAIDWGMEVMEKPYDKKLFLQKIRIKLED